MNGRLPKQLKRKLEDLPGKPGCYLMWDEHEKVLYVGKALVLRHRVRSYFQSSAKHAQRIDEMVSRVRNVTWWVTRTEMEALILENDLIKRYQPHYNVMLKDDKGYPYIKVNWQDEFPKVERVRQIVDDGARYFGPFTSSWAVSRTLESMRKVVPYLDCDRAIEGNDESPCLYYHLKLCGGPCIGVQSRDEYREGITQLIDFLEGDTDVVLGQLENRMSKAAERFNFELAAVYRDRIRSAQRIVHQQKVVGVQHDDEDVVAIAQDSKSGDTVVQIMFVRRGRLIGRENFALQQRAIFDAALSFASSEGILPAPEPAHAIWGAMQEALACKESGESKVIVFNMCGHGHFDLAAYEQHLADNLEDFDYPEEAIRASLQKVPSV